MEFISIRLGDVKPNPFRDIQHYTLEESRVEALMESMNTTGFWNNIIGRVNAEGEFEIAYGHHRLEAAIRFYSEAYVHDFPVAEINDYQMIQMMASENSEDWGNTTAHNNLTVAQVRDLIDTFCDMNPSWEDTLKPKGDSGITREKLVEWFGGENDGLAESNYNRAVVEGVGRNVIRHFLNWTDTKVRYALEQVGLSTKQRIAAEEKAAAERKRVKAKAKELREAEAKLKQAETEAEEALAREEEERIESELAKAKDDAHQASSKLAEKYDPEAGELFTKPIHAAAFRDMVTRNDISQRVPVSGQKALAEKVLASLSDRSISAVAIEQAVNEIVCPAGDAVPAYDLDNPMMRHGKLVSVADSNARGLTSAMRKLQQALRDDSVTSMGGYDSSKLHRNLCAAMESIVNLYSAFGSEPPVLARGTRTDGSFTYQVMTTAFERPVYLEFNADEFEEVA